MDGRDPPHIEPPRHARCPRLAASHGIELAVDRMDASSQRLRVFRDPAPCLEDRAPQGQVGSRDLVDQPGDRCDVLADFGGLVGAITGGISRDGAMPPPARVEMVVLGLFQLLLIGG